ncbi:hypothetical protein B0H14DRAFT_2810355 [Mycena olivaceomarginata]|nr:hypothetical protein B0H14DRAFT_2810355 [Mycena olivaceomarginata]
MPIIRIGPRPNIAANTIFLRPEEIAEKRSILTDFTMKSEPSLLPQPLLLRPLYHRPLPPLEVCRHRRRWPNHHQPPKHPSHPHRLLCLARYRVHRIQPNERQHEPCKVQRHKVARRRELYARAEVRVQPLRDGDPPEGRVEVFKDGECGDGSGWGGRGFVDGGGGEKGEGEEEEGEGLEGVVYVGPVFVGGREAGERHGEEEDGELHAEEGCGVCVGGGRGGTCVGGRKRVGQGGNSGKENGAHYTGAEHLTCQRMRNEDEGREQARAVTFATPGMKVRRHYRAGSAKGRYEALADVVAHQLLKKWLNNTDEAAQWSRFEVGARLKIPLNQGAHRGLDKRHPI